MWYPYLPPGLCFTRVPDRDMGVEVSQDDVVTTGVKKKVKNGRKIRNT